MGSNYSRIFTIINYPASIPLGWLAKMLNNIGVICSIDIEPVDNALLLQTISNRIRHASGLAQATKDEVEKQRREREVEEAKSIIREIDQKNQVLSYMTIYLMVTARELEELEYKCKELERLVSMMKLKLRIMSNFLIKDGFKAVSPCNTTPEELNKNFKQNILMSSFTGGFLFNTNVFIDEERILLRKNNRRRNCST